VAQATQQSKAGRCAAGKQAVSSNRLGNWESWFSQTKTPGTAVSHAGQPTHAPTCHPATCLLTVTCSATLPAMGSTMRPRKASLMPLLTLTASIAPVRNSAPKAGRGSGAARQWGGRPAGRAEGQRSREKHGSGQCGVAWRKAAQHGVGQQIPGPAAGGAGHWERNVAARHKQGRAMGGCRLQNTGQQS